jgi:hypothetical protein
MSLSGPQAPRLTAIHADRAPSPGGCAVQTIKTAIERLESVRYARDTVYMSLSHNSLRRAGRAGAASVSEDPAPIVINPARGVVPQASAASVDARLATLWALATSSGLRVRSKPILARGHDQTLFAAHNNAPAKAEGSPDPAQYSAISHALVRDFVPVSEQHFADEDAIDRMSIRPLNIRHSACPDRCR